MVDSYPLKDDTSETKNQHFISQVEQRQNSLNPSAELQNQRIYQFTILERDQRRIQLTAQRGLSISKSLSMEDLFSFDVKDKKVRANFEKVFESYEGRISNLTTAVLQHAPGITQHQEIFDLFIAKIINYIRNPFCIEKVINTFGSFAENHPTDAKIYNRYQKILIGNRPHQDYICSKLGITDVQYEKWLRIIFMTLNIPMPGYNNMIEHMFNTIFGSRKNFIQIDVYTYTKERCLLSDRGWTTPIKQERNWLVFHFNLNAHAFIQYTFFECDASLPPEIQQGLSQCPKQIPVYHHTDDLVALERFNRRVVEQSFEHVYCSGLSAHGVTVANQT